MNEPQTHVRRGFTIIELMVAVAIIALLISIMIPGFSAVTNKANIVATQALFQGLESGLESYRGEQMLGGVYPPSQTDNADSPLFMANPFGGPDVVGITGANLLAYALAGADQLGTPGFFDLDSDGLWSDDQGNDPGIDPPPAYALDTVTARPLRTRYPGGGATYVDETTRGTLRSLQQLFDDGIALTDPADLGNGVADQLAFTDRWGLPVLYYRANRAGGIMVTEPGGAPGVYDALDNAVFTGNPDAALNTFGVDFGPGPFPNNGFYSKIAQSEYPIVAPTLTDNVNEILVDPAYEFTMERFILDRSVTAQNRPVNARSYLLISAGKDAVYGTGDDITNWQREE